MIIATPCHDMVKRHKVRKGGSILMPLATLMDLQVVRGQTEPEFQEMDKVITK